MVISQFPENFWKVAHPTAIDGNNAPSPARYLPGLAGKPGLLGIEIKAFLYALKTRNPLVMIMMLVRKLLLPIIICLTSPICLLSCKSSSAEEGASADEISQAGTTDTKSPEDFEEEGPLDEDGKLLMPPFSTTELSQNSLLQEPQLSNLIESPAPGATYYYRGAVAQHWSSDWSLTFVAEQAGSRTTIYLVALAESGTGHRVYSIPVHQEESGKLVMKSVFGGYFGEIICRYDFRGNARVEIMKTYGNDFKPLTSLPMLDRETGEATSKEAIAAILRRLQMDGEWGHVTTEQGASGEDIWVINPCDAGMWLHFVLEKNDHYYSHTDPPILVFSYQDSYDWDISSISWTDFGNAVKLQTSTTYPGPEEKVYEYRLETASGARIFDSRYALNSQTANVLATSSEECPDDEEEH